jgi:hypothetical protein
VKAHGKWLQPTAATSRAKEMCFSIDELYAYSKETNQLEINKRKGRFPLFNYSLIAKIIRRAF